MVEIPLSKFNTQVLVLTEIDRVSSEPESNLEGFEACEVREVWLVELPG